MTNYSAGQLFLLKSSPRKNVNTSGHESKHLSEKTPLMEESENPFGQHIFKNNLCNTNPREIFLKAAQNMHSAFYSQAHDTSVVDTGQSQPLEFSI